MLEFTFLYYDYWLYLIYLTLINFNLTIHYQLAYQHHEWQQLQCQRQLHSKINYYYFNFIYFEHSLGKLYHQ